MRMIYISSFGCLVLVIFCIQIHAEPPIGMNSQIVSQNSKNGEEASVLAQLANQLLTAYSQSRFQSDNRNNPTFQNPVSANFPLRNPEQLDPTQIQNSSHNQNRNKLKKSRNPRPQTPRRSNSNPSSQTRSNKNSRPRLPQITTTEDIRQQLDNSQINYSPAISYFALVPIISDIRTGFSGPYPEFLRAFGSITNPLKGDQALVAQSSEGQRAGSGNKLTPLVAVIRPGIPGMANPVRDAERFEFPYIVDLRVCRGNNCAVSSHVCGGSIWNRNFIITAAHCFYNRMGQKINSKFLIVAGEYDMNIKDGTEQVIQVGKMNVHPLYKPANTSQGYDIAVVELTKSLNFTECKVEAGVFADVGRAKKAKIVGWGSIPPTTVPSILQAAEIDVYDSNTQECRRRNRGSANQASVVCGLRTRGNLVVDVCEGDSGGPLVCDDGRGSNYICGIVSYGFSCKNRIEFGGLLNNYVDGLSVFTKVAFYQDFIREVAGPSDNGGVKGQNCLNATDTEKSVGDFPTTTVTTDSSTNNRKIYNFDFIKAVSNYLTASTSNNAKVNHFIFRKAVSNYLSTGSNFKRR